MWLRVFLSALLLAAGVAAEPTPTADRADFSGRWVPDFARWHGMERLLDLQDAPWLARRALGRAPVVEEITQTEEALHIAVRAPLPVRVGKRRCRFDNRLREEETALGRPSRARHYWEDGATLVHVRELRDPEGRPYTLVARRRLDAGADTMRVEIVARVPGSPEHRALQVYRRDR